MAENVTQVHFKNAFKKVAVIILNYNNWIDTIACLNSVILSKPCPYLIIIVDNASINDSYLQIKKWMKAADANASTEFDMPGQLKDVYSLKKKDFLAHLDIVLLNMKVQDFELCQKIPLIMLEARINGGYAAGNNLGMRFALNVGVDACWILNNDTVIESTAFAAMRDRLFASHKPGMCGALICNFQDRQTVQCRAGGHTNKWTGLSVLNGKGLSIAEARRTSPEEVEQGVNFIFGACNMVSRTFIEQVGFMDEGYFLYSEEQDWAYRSKGRFDVVYAPDAIVYHKGGASTGWNDYSVTMKSLWFLTRSRIRCAYLHTPLMLPTVCLSIFFAAIRIIWRRLISRQWRRYAL
jgi:GT2 family glycosyltransferase